jgi:hypothetical protein
MFAVDGEDDDIILLTSVKVFNINCHNGGEFKVSLVFLFDNEIWVVLRELDIDEEADVDVDEEELGKLNCSVGDEDESSEDEDDINDGFLNIIAEFKFELNPSSRIAMMCLQKRKLIGLNLCNVLANPIELPLLPNINDSNVVFNCFKRFNLESSCRNITKPPKLFVLLLLIVVVEEAIEFDVKSTLSFIFNRVLSMTIYLALL